MDHLGRKEYICFLKDVCQVLIGCFLSRIESKFRMFFRSTTAILRISHVCGCSVARHVNFRNYLNVPFGCILYNFIDLILIIIFCRCKWIKIISYATYQSQLRIFFDIYTPAGLVGEVPVKPV
ncbi:hypothetical protein D3C87_1324480 [compost metagenome]